MSKNLRLNLVGTDLEVFLRDNLTGQPVPVCGLVGGTKEEPRRVLNSYGFAVQEDNVMLEFNIPAAPAKRDFVTSLDRMMRFIQKEISDHGLHVDVAPSMLFQPEQLLSPQAMQIGCEPDFNAYRKVERKITVEEMGNMRCAGGHVHVSFFEDATEDNPDGYPDDEARLLLVRAMDLHHGLASLFFDTDMQRRRLYGKAGMYRPKSYGIEYRSLSNAWLRSKELSGWVFDAVGEAIAFVNRGGETPDKVENIINERDLTAASQMIRFFGINMPKGIQY
jgi:hypothetical protein